MKNLPLWDTVFTHGLSLDYDLSDRKCCWGFLALYDLGVPCAMINIAKSAGLCTLHYRVELLPLWNGELVTATC